jgi:hypothetical protein
MKEIYCEASLTGCLVTKQRKWESHRLRPGGRTSKLPLAISTLRYMMRSLSWRACCFWRLLRGLRKMGSRLRVSLIGWRTKLSKRQWIRQRQAQRRKSRNSQLSMWYTCSTSFSLRLFTNLLAKMNLAKTSLSSPSHRYKLESNFTPPLPQVAISTFLRPVLPAAFKHHRTRS